MIKTNDLYEATFRRQFRNRSFFQLDIGVISQKAQATSQVQNSGNAYLSNNSIFSQNKRKNYYATAEQDFLKLDGGMMVTPKYPASNMTNGWVGNLDQPLDITFGGEILAGGFDLKGFVIRFAEKYPPTDFTVSLTHVDGTVESYTVTNNSAVNYSNDYAFTSINHIKITATAFPGGRVSRLRIEEIKFGIGITFTNKEIKNLTFKSYTSPIAGDVPQVDVSVTIDNSNGKYDIQDESSAINFLEERQNGILTYGYEMDDGSVYYFTLATIKMKSWSSDDSSAKFELSDMLDNQNDIYYKGKVSDTDVTLYALAEDVVTDMGLNPNQYFIDPWLKKVTTRNPLPKLPHKECLQYIANAGMCNFSIETDGSISLRNSFIPDAAVSKSNGLALVSTEQNILSSGSSHKVIATAEKNMLKLNGRCFCGDRNGDVSGNCFTSAGLSFSSTGDINAQIRIRFAARCILNGFSVFFPEECSLPKEFKVMYSLVDDKGTEKRVSKIITDIDYETKVDFSYSDVSYVDIIITKVSDRNQRARISYVSLGDNTNYTISYSEMIKPPVGKLVEKVKRVTVSRTIFTIGTELKELANAQVIADVGDNTYTITWEAPANPTAIEVTDTSGTVVNVGAVIQESGCYYCQVYLPNIAESSSLKLSIKGYEYLTSEIGYNSETGSKGQTKVLSNQLIYTEENAKDVLNWLTTYFMGDTEYTLNYRGDARLQSKDVIRAVMRNNAESTKIKITETQLTFDGGVKGTIKARRDLSARDSEEGLE